MTNIIPLHKKDDTPRATGEAFCMHCKYEWVAVSPSGIHERFECPACASHKGMFKYQFAPSDDDELYECNCGNHLFYIMPEGHLCANCGIYNEY